MFFSFGGFLLLIFSNTFLGLEALVELSKVDFDVLITTEDIIRNVTNNILSNLLLEKSVNSTRVREFSIIHQYFLSVTFQDSDNLKEISRLSRADYKKFNNSTKNLTTLINEFLNDDECDVKANQTEEQDNGYISQHVGSFLAKLEALKESYGVNKVLTDINSNIVKILEESSKLRARGNDSRNFTDYNDTDVDDAFLQDSNEFWIPSGRRIYKGQRTKIKYYPFMASIHIFNTFQCAGSIIKSDLIITASSCLQLAWNNRFYRENPAFLSVRVGSSFYNGGGENIPVLEIYFHPDYHPKNLWNNICVLRLVRHIQFLKKTRKSVKKIAIDKHPWNLPTNTPGITIVGWGAKGSNTLADPWVNIISFAVLDVYPLQECQEVYSKQYVTKNNFCGGFFAKGSGACNRDVGAPGIVDGTLMGVVSFGSPVCGTPDAPTVFTKLGYYYSWIKTIMDLNVPQSKKKATPKDIFDPLAPYRTTRITTTTFTIEPLEEGEKPPSVPSETDLDDALRTLDDKLFHEFLETMFGSNEVKKYDSLLNQNIKVLKDKNNIDNIQQENQVTEGYATESSKVTDYNEHKDLYIPLTQGFESTDVPRTQLMVVDNDPITEEYSHVIEDIPEDHNAYHKIYKSVQKYTTKIKRKHKSNNPNQFMSTTVNTQPQIFLELATESSADSDQSGALQSGIKLIIPKEINEKYSSEASDIPGEQVISELLDEIDLNEILREGTTASTVVSKPFHSYKKKVLSKKGHILSSIPVAPNKYNNVKTKDKSVGSIEKKDKNSVLTLLYLSDDEKKHNVNPYIGNVLKIEDKFTAANDGADCKDCSKIYNIVPKSELFKIISRVLKVAIGNKV